MHDIKASSGWRSLLQSIYGAELASVATGDIETLLATHGHRPQSQSRWDERDAWFITYPDQIRSDEWTPLDTLRRFYISHLAESFNGIHVLPFFPSSSDEGFSVRNYQAVAMDFGTWSDIAAIGQDSRLMIDAVVNHCSASSEYFERWAGGDPAMEDFFRTADPEADLAATVRARAHPLLTKATTSRGEEWLWTTFSSDQIDLNYSNPKVLVFMLENLLEYAGRGASAIRLDAACFLWKQEGTTSIHLPQTHQIIQFFRSCLNETYPDVILVSETNVPHEENISYLGNGSIPEADMVYQFTLPPMVLHAFVTGQACNLTDWLGTLRAGPPGTTWLNFLSSHDGVGLRPLEGLVDSTAIEQLVLEAKRHGGKVNMRQRSDGISAPYELNATWYDLIRGEHDEEDALARHVASHAIMFSLAGIPAVYAHGLLASHNDIALIESSGSARSINRTRMALVDVEQTLVNAASRATRSMSQMTQMLHWRASTDAFHPSSDQVILDTPDTVVGVERTGESGERARVYVNVSGTATEIESGTESSARGFRYEQNSHRYNLGSWGVLWLFDQ